MPKKINYSEMKNRIIFQTQSIVDDKTTWSDFMEVWSKISPFRSYSDPALPFRHGVLESKTGYKIIIRYDSNINSQMRIKFGEKILRIEKLLNIDEENKWTEIESLTEK